MTDVTEEIHERLDDIEDLLDEMRDDVASLATTVAGLSALRPLHAPEPCDRRKGWLRGLAYGDPVWFTDRSGKLFRGWIARVTPTGKMKVSKYSNGAHAMLFQPTGGSSHGRTIVARRCCDTCCCECCE